MLNSSKVTIRDVAKAAGVSPQTVSRVINNRPDVSPKTRSQIEKIIVELGYTPNSIAQSLSSGRSKTLGVVGFGLEYFGITSSLIGIERGANQLGFSILLSLLDQLDEEKIECVLSQLTAQQVEGIIWSIPGFIDIMDMIGEITKDLTVPVVFLNTVSSDGNIVVSVDNRTGGRLATEHLFNQGYRKVGIITGPANWWEAQERLAGWREVMCERNVIGYEDLIYEGDWEAQSGEQGFHALYTIAPDLDAVFVCNDQMSLGALHAANRIGLKVPKDVGIVGFDDIPEASYFSPPLTTVRQNIRELGSRAVSRLMESINAAPDEERIRTQKHLVAPELIIRQSSVRDKS